MNIYIPHKWTLHSILFEKENVEEIKILSTWYGSYLEGESWRLSSGIVDIEEEEDFYIIKNHSGSVYRCIKDREGFSGYGATIAKQMKEFTHITIEQAKQLLERNKTSDEDKV